MCGACEILRLNQESAAFLLFGEFFCFFQYLILGGDSMPVRVVDRIICCNFCCCSCCHNHEPPTLWAKHSLIKGLREFLAKFVRASTLYLTRILVHRFKKLGSSLWCFWLIPLNTRDESPSLTRLVYAFPHQQ